MDNSHDHQHTTTNPGARSRLRGGLVVALALACLGPLTACDASESESEAEDTELREFTAGETPPQTFQLRAVEAGLVVESEPITRQPRYGNTDVAEFVGVKNGGAKTFEFRVHPNNARAGFKINFVGVGAGKDRARVKLSTDGTTWKTCNNTPNTSCTITRDSEEATTVTMRVEWKGGKKTNYLAYDSSYLQGCDVLSGRYCGTLERFHDTQVTFDGQTENGLSQGNVKLFPVSAGDLVTLNFTSSEPIIGQNPPTLRVFGGSGQELGHRYACEDPDEDGVYECEVPGTDTIPEGGVLWLASRRAAPGATFHMWNVTRTSIDVSTCTGS